MYFTKLLFNITKILLNKIAFIAYALMQAYVYLREDFAVNVKPSSQSSPLTTVTSFSLLRFSSPDTLRTSLI